MDRIGNDQMKGKGGMGCDPSTSVVDGSPAKAEGSEGHGKLANETSKDFQFSWHLCRALISCLPEFTDIGKLNNRLIAQQVNGNKTLDTWKLLSILSYALKEGKNISASAEDAIYCARVTRASWNPSSEDPDAKFLCKAKALVEARTPLDPGTYSEPLPLKPRKRVSMSESSCVCGKVIKKKPRRKPATRTPPAKGVGKGSGMLAGGRLAKPNTP